MSVRFVRIEQESRRYSVCLFDLYGPDRRGMHLQFQNGLPEPTANMIPVSVDVGGATVQSGRWPMSEVANTGCSRVFSIAGISPLPSGPAQQPVVEAIALPVKSPGEDRPIGVLITGVNPTRKLDAEYSAFYELVAAHLGTAIANARAYEEDRQTYPGRAQVHGDPRCSVTHS
jgi:hypothetical protein